MKYLDENIEITISGIVVPAAGTYSYQVYQGNNEVIFHGNTFLNAGDTTKTFDITDVIANLKWKGSLVKPLPHSRTEKVNVINQYKVVLTIGSTTYDSSYLDVALIYRYPNRKRALEADILGANNISSQIFKNCLQGSKNGVCALLPHIPYKMTGEYAFGAVAEYASTNNFNDSIEFDYEFEGQLYNTSAITATWSGATTQNIRSLNVFYGYSNESEKLTRSINVDVQGFGRPSTHYSPSDVYISTSRMIEMPTAIYVCTGTNGQSQLGRYPFVDGKVHVVLDAVPSNARFFIKHNSSDASSDYIRFGSVIWNNITYPIHIEFDAEIKGVDVVIKNVQFSKGRAYQNETYLNVKTTKYLTSVVAEAIQEGVTSGECKTFLMTMGYTMMETVDIIEKLRQFQSVTIFVGTSSEASSVYSNASGYFDAYTDDGTGPYDDPQHVAIVDIGCLPKYYLLWQDRYGGYQSQSFDKTETFSIDYTYDEMKDYQNRRRNITVKVQPSWKIQTGWIDEEYYPYYESIFSSPYVLLYDTEEDVSYNVIATEKKYTEKTWKNQHKFFNLQLNLEENKIQNIIY